MPGSTFPKSPHLIRNYIRLMEKMGNNLLLSSIRRGFTLMIPVMLIGSFALLFYSFPIPQYQNLMETCLGPEWKSFFVYVHDGTISILSLNTAVCISYSLIVELTKGRNTGVSPIITACVALCSFVALLGTSKAEFKLADLGIMGIFAAMLTAVAASALFYRLSTIGRFRIKPFSDGDSVTFGNAVSAVIPAAITIAVFAAVNQILYVVFHFTDINAFLYHILSKLFSSMGNNFLSALTFTFLSHFFWFFGIHGGNVLEHIAQSIYVPALAVNQNLVHAGFAPTQIFTKTFFDTFVLMGGCGSSICLILAVFILKGNKNQRRIAKLSLVPLLFNINELVVFGFPIVLNPIYVIPFLLVPILLMITSFAAMGLGLVPFTCHTVEWTTPVFISGYYATGSLRGSLLQLFNLFLGIACYLPFVRLSQIVSFSRQKKNYYRLCQEFKNTEGRNLRPRLLERQDIIGSLSKALAEDLRDSLRDGYITLFYQPQVDYDGRVFCAEGLLRWKHAIYGYIYPPLAIALAEEYHIMDQLGFYVIEQACRAIANLNARGYRTIAISVNITATQLKNEAFCRELFRIVERHKVDPHFLKLEITEQVALEHDIKIKQTLSAIHDGGIRLEMDDFGMGHSSLLYLKEYHFHTIKLDGSLVREICSNPSCREIIASIVYLSKSLNYNVLAEFVETEEQRRILHTLGCNQYQGQLFSKAISFEKLVDYIIGAEQGQKVGVSEQAGSTH